MVLQEILGELVDGRMKGQARPKSVDLMLELVVKTTTGFLPDNKVQTSQTKTRSALEIFQESIRNVANQEATLFKQFEQYLTGTAETTEEKGGDPSFPSLEGDHRSTYSQPANKTPGQSQESDQSKTPFHDITREIKLLREVKDIRDELYILKSLVEDQSEVWKQAFKGGAANDQPNYLKVEIVEMAKEAADVQRAIDVLLDLKQKQANISEAKEAGEQTKHSSKQNDTIMVFTIVTIIFTPMSFLTSVFALNVTDFPHQSGTVTYQGWWIFPIIFGVSFAVSAIFISFAFNASWVMEAFRQWKIFKEKEKKLHHRQTSLASSSESSESTSTPSSTKQSIREKTSAKETSIQTQRLPRYRWLRSRDIPDVEQQ
ncbi:hypothetical protein BO70DRAFT_396055 [Aspergillus heteromorphus CBS 117.55]|uniref:Ankyrin repeat protein n=1 Tax=Aspergillus heteromorphus CBS 117.55 TaxID=1448321 RepID=A0A317WBP8_9EURO|nr:uncharacterized protein BO70DRAFT_396055 [Aspergillus heteromorphus CBS 117.55]PWY83629.1 hypothetical protein BO70DRAFT_396055 [Aspergillus heteromorphus CBS 117.55]